MVCRIKATMRKCPTTTVRQSLRGRERTSKIPAVIPYQLRDSVRPGSTSVRPLTSLKSNSSPSSRKVKKRLTLVAKRSTRSNVKKAAVTATNKGSKVRKLVKTKLKTTQRKGSRSLGLRPRRDINKYPDSTVVTWNKTKIHPKTAAANNTVTGRTKATRRGVLRKRIAESDVAEDIKIKGDDGPPAPKRKRATKSIEDSKAGSSAKSAKDTPSRRRKITLNPKPFVTLYEKDPTFESRIEIPSISSLADSRLLIRAVKLGDNKLLESYLKKDQWICSKAIPRSVVDPSTALTYAFKTENIAAIKMLLDNDTYLPTLLAPKPELLLRQESTGQGSHMMFGHRLRAITVARGGREGNTAFLKDQSWYEGEVPRVNCLEAHEFKAVLKAGIKFETIEALQNVRILKLRWLSEHYTLLSDALEYIVHAVRGGHVELAWRLIKEARLRDGFGFNLLHEEVLNPNKEPLSPFIAASVIKMAYENSRISPLHCAAINPNTSYLSALLSVRPEVNDVEDEKGWTVLHYAAVSKSRKPLDILFGRGALSTLSGNSKGNTPLHLACELGRFENVQSILQYELSRLEGNDTMDGVQKLSSTSMVLVNSEGFRPIQLAAKEGHTDIVRYILSIPGKDVKKGPTVQFGKISFLLAAQYGHLPLVKFLTEERETLRLKLEGGDRRGRTALTLAVINGQAHIVSFLLRLGMNHLTTDSSGNTLLHYGGAYGWYFICKLLIQAGCSPMEGNQWKLTPVAAAFMKGHIGIVKLFLGSKGVDINSPVNLDTGRSLLHETCASGQVSKDLVDRITFLVDELKADCSAVDFNGNNALHLLVHSYGEHAKSYDDSWTPFESTSAHSRLVQAIKLLLQHGCNPEALNQDQVSPVTIAIRNGSFTLLTFTFYDRKLNLEISRATRNSEGDNLLHSMALHAEKDSAELFIQLLGKNRKNLATLREMAKERNNLGLTPLHQLLTKFQRSYNGTKEEEEELDKLRKFCRFLITELRSDVDAKVETEGHHSSVIHLACLYGNFPGIVMEENPDLEVRDSVGNTPLSSAVLRKKTELIETLIKAGAGIHAPVYQQKGDSDPRSILLVLAENGSVFSIFPGLVKDGANVFAVDSKGNSSLHHICKLPTGPGALEAATAILQGGYPADSVNAEGRTPLHLCVNSRRGEMDVFYDIELALIEAAPRALSLRDIRGRLPLHYAFVKRRNFRDSSYLDPIELTDILVGGMKAGNYAGEILAPDNFGGTPLHYAAARGALISSSLLFGENGAALNLRDNNGNSPFGLAVLNSHEPCAFHYQQKNADFTLEINKKREAVPVKTPEDPYNNKSWEWSRFRMERAETLKSSLLRPELVTILEEVILHNWQGLLYMMVEGLRGRGKGAGLALQAAITTRWFRFGQKLLLRIRNVKDLEIDPKQGTLLHVMASTSFSHAPEHQEFLRLLLSKGVDVMAEDEQGTNALVHAVLNRNSALAEELGKGIREASGGNLLRQDSIGRSVFSAAFWEPTDISEPMRSWLNGYEGISGNVLTYFRVKLSQLPAVRYLRTAEVNFDADNSFSPLIISVIFQNYDAVKWLLTDCTAPVDVNFQDGLGRTALMHAVRLNDIKMMKLLLSPQDYDPKTDIFPWRETAFQVTNAKIDLTIKDKKGFTALHHIVKPSELQFSYAHSDLTLKLLQEASPDLDISVLELAKSLQRFHLARTITQLLRLEDEESLEEEGSDPYTDFPPVIPQNVNIDTSNMEADAKAMAAEILNRESTEKDMTTVKPDPLVGGEASEFEVVYEDEQPYDCLMTKVDLNYGRFGLYNFYKMQLLRQPKGKKMILLFTRWGRMGDEGQYQKTPFGTVQEAIKEFKQIFRSKSGNIWDEGLERFKHMPDKYRLVRKALSAVRPVQFQLDFPALLESTAEGKDGSRLSKEVHRLVKELVAVHRTGSPGQGGTLPFGNVSRDALVKGEEILDRIKLLLEDKKKLAPDHKREEEQKIMDAIVEASEEFYSLVPVHDFNSERALPMFDIKDVRQRKEALQSHLHRELATELLLASQFNSNSKQQQHNPIDYIYSCLKTHIQPLAQDEFESQMILQYIHNGSLGNPKIFNIYRLEREGESPTGGRSTPGNPWLLWHGPKSVDMLSILRRGLQAEPLGTTALCGRLSSRKGIHFWDMFARSASYAQGGSSGRNKYLLLCEVALGSVCSLELSAINEDMGDLSPEFNSLKTEDSCYVPDPSGTIHWQNRAVPLGEQITQVLRTVDGRYRYHGNGLYYNEYIVFEPEQVRLKYLVEFVD